MDMINKKIQTLLNVLKDNIEKELMVPEFEYAEYGYKTSNNPPSDLDWKTFEKGTKITGVDRHYWLRFRLDPILEKKNCQLRFYLKTGREGQWDATNPQGTVFINGKTVQALDVNHTYFPIDWDTPCEIYIYFYTGMEGGEFDLLPSVKSADLTVEKLYYDIKVPYECLEFVPSGENEYYKIQNALNEALLLVDFRNSGSEEFVNSVAAADEFLRSEFYGKECHPSEKLLSCIGHTHIDVAWKWTVAQTREKAQRSFSTVLNLMDRYPDYKFMSSQPQLYKFVKEDDPALYERIKEKIREGRWEVEGAMWLEADTNLTSGESLVRQILYGKQFMREEFGAESHILWLPDVFGYSGALPQILKKSGVDRFFTAKISWNETNKIPHDTFIWEGIDKSQVFANLIVGYVGILQPDDVYWRYKDYKDKNINQNAMMTFGWADGGGGPDSNMLENYERLKRGIPGMPTAKIETAKEFFNRSEKNFKENCEKLKTTPKWVDELYLEYHRGTYTSIAKNKKNNRKSELLFQMAESLAVTDCALLGGSYPNDDIHRGWETILLNQFHDIIPGSSIGEVYEQSDKEYTEIFKVVNEITGCALENIKKNIRTNGGIFVYNPTSYALSDVITLGGKTFKAENIPAHGWRVIENPEAADEVLVSENIIENDLLKVTFDEKGQIISIFDKEHSREVLQMGEIGNTLEIYEDFPYSYDAWEISEYYKQKKYIIDDLESIEIIPFGIKITGKYNKSRFIQEITLKPGSRRLDFKTKVDWQETHTLLKAAFPLNIHSRNATYEIQFGSIERPTHKNTSWDQAKFEVCGHKWADMSEGDYGVGLLNDCKYGYSAEDNVLSLTLLKSATYPYEKADKGEHEFTYSLYPHGGNLASCDICSEAALLNNPLIAEEIGENNGVLSDNFSLASSDKKNIVIDTIKKAEDGDDIIIRLYNSANSKSSANITLGFDFKEAYICDLMEENEVLIPHNKRTIPLDVKNFEIITLKLKMTC